MAIADRRMTSLHLDRFRLPGDARLSPDGRNVAYMLTSIHVDANDYESAIWCVPAAGDGPPRRLTGGTGKGHCREHSPRWSPDGRTLAFISDRGGGSEVWLLELALGGEARQLTRATGNVSALAWSPDGQWIAYAATPARPAPREPGDWLGTGWRPGENPDVTVVTRLRYKFNGRGILDERYSKLHLIEVASGAARQVTCGPFDDSSPVWSPDGRWLGFCSSRRSDRELHPRADVWCLDLLPIVAGGADGSRQPELEPVQVSAAHSGSLGSPSWSPDGHWLLCAGQADEMGGASNTHLWLVPFAHALEHGREAARAGTGAAAGVESRPAASAWLDILAGFDRGLGNSIGADVRADPGGDPVWSRDGRWIYFSATDGGRCRLYRVLLPEGVPLEDYVPCLEELTAVSPAVVGSFTYAETEPGRGVLSFVAGDPANPADIYCARAPAGGPSRAAGAAAPRGTAEGGDAEPLTPLGAPVHRRPVRCLRLTKHNPWLEDLELSLPERVVFPSVEHGLLEGWLMKPLGARPEKRHPVVLEIHGGPHVTYGLAFMHEFQLLCARGFGVFYTNPRGSKGYGEAFAARVVGDWAGIDHQDLLAAADYLAAVPWADPARMGVTGGSQGGYHTNFLIGHTTRFAAAVAQRSMSNLYTKYGVSDIGWTGDKHGMGGRDLWDSEDFIMERSPIRYAPRVRTPTLIIHSEQDLRCPMEQAEQWYVALKRLGVQTEFVRFAGENHELSRSGKPRNRVERLERIVGWFERFMPPCSTGPGPTAGR